MSIADWLTITNITMTMVPTVAVGYVGRKTFPAGEAASVPGPASPVS